MSRLLRRVHRRVYAQTQIVAQDLEVRLERAVLRASQRNPGKKVVGVSAMGTWCLSVGAQDRNPPVFRSFEDALDLLGWDAIPAPVRFVALDGRLRKDTDWGADGCPAP